MLLKLTLTGGYFRETTLHALRGVITPAGDKISEPIKKQIYGTLVIYLGQPEDTIRKSAAGCLGALCKYLPPDQLDVTLGEHILSKFFHLFKFSSITGVIINFR